MAPTGVGETLSLGFTRERERVPQSFRFHCHTLHDPAIQQGVPPMKVVLDRSQHHSNRTRQSSIDLIKKLGNILAESKTLFLIDDIIADKTVDK